MDSAESRIPEQAPAHTVNGGGADLPVAPEKVNGHSEPVVKPPFSWLSQPHVQFVIILVGSDEVPFALHLDFICARSKYFEQKLVSTQDEKPFEPIVRLPNTTPEVFGFAQNFLYTGHVISVSGETPSYELLIGVWKLGHMLDIDGLCDKALAAMLDCRRITKHIPATPLLIQVWEDTPEGSSIRKLLLSWAAEYMRASETRAEFAKSLPQEVLSELVIIMSSLESAPPPAPEPSPDTAQPASAPGTAPRKSVHYLEDDSDDERARGAKKSRRVSAVAPAVASTPTASMERKPPAVRKAVKAALPKRRSSAAVAIADGDISTERKVEFCADLLERMLSGPGFWTRLVGPFKDPVDPEKDHVPDYFEKVKKPMDLATVKLKMDRQEYTNENEFAADVRLIFENCYTYWNRNDPMWAACEKFQKTFEDKYSQMTKTISKLMREPAD
ncbi:hypothetical protein BN1723_015217 [Verticillium longisporum]|uniref:Bromo domain-containing protein n=1 Tax=Verticillium longisporum TaxID=100787 RepID=A0A0G4MTQ0_VERLO|nr:hypothetical protein BN1723_015217 [Verticillium longisporum]